MINKNELWKCKKVTVHNEKNKENFRRTIRQEDKRTKNRENLGILDYQFQHLI